jgi:hypothetical protein
MWLADIVRIADSKIQRMAQRFRDYRGTDMHKIQSDWGTVVVYQQAQIENLQRNVRRLFERAGDQPCGFDPILLDIAGTVEIETLPPVKFTHEREFHEFLQRTRERFWQCGQHGMDSTPGFDLEAAALAQKLFGRSKPESAKSFRSEAQIDEEEPILYRDQLDDF